MQKYTTPSPTLQEPPAGFGSVLGLKNSPSKPSFFTENEYVVFNTDQVRIKYLVELTGADDVSKSSNDVVMASSLVSIRNNYGNPLPVIPPENLYPNNCVRVSAHVVYV